MKTAAGRVVGNGGMVELESRLPKGGRVQVVYVGKGGWTLDAADTKKLLKSLAQAKRGEVFDAADVIAEVHRRK